MMKTMKKDAMLNRQQLAEKAALRWSLPIGIIVAFIWYFVFRFGLGHSALPLTGWPSIGAAMLINSAVLTTILFPIGYLIGMQYMAKGNPVYRFGLLKKVLNTVSLTIAYVIVASLLTAVGIYVFNQAFKGIQFDIFTSSYFIGGLAAGLSYVLIGIAIRIETRNIVNAFTVCMAGGVLASMVTAQNPYWWQENFSSLGESSTFSSYAFNFSLMLSGLLMICLSQHLFIDLNQVISRHKDQAELRANTIRTLFIFIAICLAGVGFFPYNEHPLLHNLSAYSMVLGFGGLVIGLRWLIPTISKDFLTISYVILGAVGTAYILFTRIGYLNLTAFELTAFSLTFVWLVLFLRTIELIKKS